eukprot:s1136_g29.t1
MDQANLLDFKIHQLWVDRLIKVRLQVPPPGYSKTTFRQLLEADKKLFEEISDESRHGVQANAKDKGRPLDLIFEKCMNKAEVMHLLQPLMGKASESKHDDKISNNKAAPYRQQSAPKGPEVLSEVDAGEPHFVELPKQVSREGDKSVEEAPRTVEATSSRSHEGDHQVSTTEGCFDHSPPRLLREAPLFIEACCGSALLSACASKAGFDILAIDFHGNKHRPFVHVVELDLRKESTWNFLEHLAATRTPFHFHAAPPCGTASRARDVPLGPNQHGPPPLRSDEFPMGLPWIRGFWKDKLDSANAIYILLASFCFWLNALGVGWSIENPGRSYLWSIEDYKLLISIAFFVLFHSCIHGSERKKLTGLLTNRKELDVLGGYCQDDHDHLPWSHTTEDGRTVFDTSKEAAYPKLFCERFVHVLSDLAGLSSATDNPGLSAQDANIDARVATSKQPRGRKLPQLVSECASVRTIRAEASDEPLVSDKRTLSAPFHGIPAGSKLLRSAKAKRGQAGTNEPQMIRVFGIYRSMAEFMSVAKSVLHPFDSFRAVPDFLLHVVCRILGRTPLETMKIRLDKLKLWRQQAENLAQCNADIFRSIDSGCARVLKGKHLALLEQLATEINWPDTAVHAEVRNGFKLIGMQPPSGIFAADIKPRTLSEEDLNKQLRFLKPALWLKVQSATRTDYEQELWDIKLQEMQEKGWLEGPYSKDDLDVLFDDRWLPVRRFAVWQRSKWRPIDDFSECGVNSTFSYLERVDLKALDEIIWMACCFIKFCIFEERFDFTLTSGERLCGRVHDEWRSMAAESVQLVAKTVALDTELPFDTKAEMLGVVLDLSESTKGSVKVSNKPSRVQELSLVMEEILKAGKVEVKALPALFGRALFMESQFMGKNGKLALTELRLLEKSNKNFVSLNDLQIQAMKNLLDRYRNAAPRTLKVETTTYPCVIFTDGACERSSDGIVCAVGGVLLDPLESGTVQAFGTFVCKETVKTWEDAGKQHPVSQTEMYAECIARSIWKDRIDGRKCLFFIDHQGDLDALIKGYSTEDTLKALLVMLKKLDADNPCLPWYCRVPSSSNISDLPSRGRWKELFELLPECVVIDPSCPFSSRKLQRIPESTSGKG